VKGWLLTLGGIIVIGSIAPISLGYPVVGERQSSSRVSGAQRSPAPVVLANDRLEVLVPAHPLTLAEPCEISLRLHSPGLTSLITAQTQYASDQPDVPDAADGSRQELPIQYRPNGSPYITIIPMRLGRIELDLGGRFPDGGVVEKKATFEVSPTRQRPDKLIVGPVNHNVEWVLMATSGAAMRSALFPYAKYATLPIAVKIDPSFATYRIVASDQPVPVQIDAKTGRLTATHSGQALLETSYGGRANLTCIEVNGPSEQNRPFQQTNCRPLLSPGLHLGPQN